MKPKFSFDWLISPIDKQVFIDEYLENKPLIIKRNNTQYYKEFITLNDIDNILIQCQRSNICNTLLSSSTETFNPNNYSVNKQIGYVNVKKGINLTKVLDHFVSKKASILINDSVNLLPSLQSLSKNVSEAIYEKTGANIFITPNNAQCFDTHFDEHDLFIIQLYGKKKWEIYDDPQYLPLQPQNNRPFDFTKSKVLETVILEQGDLLFLPRGFVHKVSTVDMSSVHITFGYISTTWTHLFQEMVLKIAEEHPLLRKRYTNLKTNNSKNVILEEIYKILDKEISFDKVEQIYESKKQVLIEEITKNQNFLNY